MGKEVKRQLSDGLAKIDQSQLPGKYKLWSYKFILVQRVMWHLKMSNFPLSVVQKMGCYIQKCLGLPRCFSDVGLERRETTDQLVRASSSQV